MSESSQHSGLFCAEDDTFNVAERWLFGRSATLTFSTTCPVKIMNGGYTSLPPQDPRSRRPSRLYLSTCRMEFWDKDKRACAIACMILTCSAVVSSDH